MLAPSPDNVVPNASRRKLPQLPVEQLISRQAAAKELGVSRGTIPNMISDERLDAGLDPYGVVKPTRESVARLKAQLAEQQQETAAAA